MNMTHLHAVHVPDSTLFFFSYFLIFSFIIPFSRNLTVDVKFLRFSFCLYIVAWLKEKLTVKLLYASTLKMMSHRAAFLKEYRVKCSF